jgi:uncharacterized protein YegP (UPF0339 family)
MAAKFVLKKGSTGKFRFNLVATNGQVIATSEAYESTASAIKGIESVKRNVPTAEIDDQPDQEPAVPHDAVIGLAVPGRPIGPGRGGPERQRRPRPDGFGLACDLTRRACLAGRRPRSAVMEGVRRPRRSWVASSWASWRAS